MKTNTAKILICIVALTVAPLLCAFLLYQLFGGFYSGQLSFSKNFLTAFFFTVLACLATLFTLFAVVDASRRILRVDKLNSYEKNRAKESNEYHRYISEHDMLTNLHNKAYLQNVFNKSCTDSRVALIFLDLDNFKQINDLMGHNVGDMLLRKVAEKLKKVCSGNEIVSRAGGDEFVILKPFQDKTEIIKFGKEILDVFTVPIEIFGRLFSVTASVGAALYPDNGWDFHEIYKNADTAMYESKHAGKSVFSLYSPHMHEQILETYEILKYVRSYEKYCFVEYQPIVSIATGEICGFEALTRMQVDGNVIPPSDFIPVAVQNGLIADVGRFVLKETCEFVAGLEKKGINVGYVTVNVSANQFFAGDFMKNIKDIIASTNVCAEKLLFELTEDIVVKYNETKAVIEELQLLGIKTGIDDFGTGYASLEHLAKLPMKLLKLDKGFVNNIGQDKENQIIELVVNLSKTLKMNTCAEGIEKKEQLEFLRAKGCALGQGYLFSKPLKGDYIEQNVNKLIMNAAEIAGVKVTEYNPAVFGFIKSGM